MVLTETLSGVVAEKKKVLGHTFKWTDDGFPDTEDDNSEVGESLSRKDLKRKGTMGFGTGAARRDGRCTRVLYLIERALASGGRLLQIVMLLFLGGVQVTLLGLVYSIVWRYEDGSDPREEHRVSRYIEGIWNAWTFMSDGGTHAKVFHGEQRLVAGMITVAGIIYLATVLAFIVDVVREKMDSMRLGNGQVYELGHTVILHWTDRTIPLLQELCIANESEGGGVIVVLAKESIQTMQAEMAVQLPDFMRRGTRIVLRHGNPALVSDLIKAAVDRAKAVVCLSLGHKVDDSDSGTLRCILSLKSIGYPMQGHVVAEVQDVDNEPLLQLVGGKLIETFVSHDVVGRLMLMCVRPLGLAAVYDALLGFEGNEFYMKAWPELAGVPFGELTERLPQAVPIGVRSVNGDLRLNPSRSYLLEESDELIVIAEDDNTYQPETAAEVNVGESPVVPMKIPKIEKVLICGWRHDFSDILKLLDDLVKYQSEVHTMTHYLPVDKRNQVLNEEGLNIEDLQHIRLVHHAGNTSVRRRLELLPLETYSSIIIFADQAYEDDTMQADSHSLATLVLIRDIQHHRLRGVGCPITCEILDLRTQRTISGQKQLRFLSDFMQSNKFVARILAMISENRSVNAILTELLGVSGCNLAIVRSSLYVFPKERVSFWTVAKRAQQHGSILLGAKSTTSSKKVILNPPDKTRERSWDNWDLAVLQGSIVHRQSFMQTSAVNSIAASLSEKTKPRERPDLATLLGQPASSNTQAQDINVNRSARALEARPAHLHDFVDQEDDTDDVPNDDEGGVCSSADTAIGAMAKLAMKFSRVMSHGEQQRLGSCMIHLGERLQEDRIEMSPAGGMDLLPLTPTTASAVSVASK